MIFYETLIQSSGPTRSHLARFARARFTLRAHENFRKKKCVSIDSKCSETHKNAKKNFYPFDSFLARSEHSERRSATLPTPKVASLPRASRFALAFSVASLHRAFRFALALFGRFAPSGFALRARYLSYDTPRVPRSVHAKFHDDRIKTMGARGIHT